ncbi:MAG: serine protease [Candidatus Neomarinimicrobiota bacterium]|nr:MAG: serine protease [Candidatus Neomarinimicrobiota bacterium]
MIHQPGGKTGIRLSGFVLVLVSLTWTACSKLGFLPPSRSIDTGNQRVSEVAQQLARSLIRINYVATYSITGFSLSDRMTTQRLRDSLSTDLNASLRFENVTASGTGILLEATPTEVIVLTCAHIGNRPDTVLTYYSPSPPGYLQAVGLKVHEKYYSSELSGIREMELLVEDRLSDLALLGAHRAGNAEYRPAVPFPLLSTANLKWGEPIFIMGYPLGHLMLTGGRISAPESDTPYLLLDALFNPGFSGGLVFSCDNADRKAYWIGVAKSVAASSQWLLSPPADSLPSSDFSTFPYTGTPWVTRQQQIHYGVTFAIRSETVAAFLSAANPALREKGYGTLNTAIQQPD